MILPHPGQNLIHDTIGSLTNCRHMNSKTLLIVSYVFLGFSALIIQTVGIREIFVVASGNELCLGIVFGCWFAGVAIGAWLMGLLARRVLVPRDLYIFLFMLLCLVFPIQLVCIRMLRIFFTIPPGQIFPPGLLFLGTFATVAPVSLLIGALFPLACQSLQNVSHAHRMTSAIGLIYLAEALGSIAGGLCFTFFLVTRYHAFDIAMLLGMCGSLGMMFLVLREKENPQKIFIALLVFFCSGAFGYGYISSFADNLDQRTVRQRWNTLQPHLELIGSTDSRYGHLTLGKQAEQYILFSNGEYVAVFPDEYNAAMTAHLYLSEHPNPRQILLIGGGAEGLIPEILKHPVEHLDYVEIDQRLFDFIAAYLPASTRAAFDDARVSRIHIDGRYYVKHAARMYDMVILNLPDPTTAVLNRFYTLEFFQEVQHILTSNGVVVTSLSSSVQLQEDVAHYVGSLYKTLLAVFPHVYVIPGSTNIFFAALQPDIISVNAQFLADRYQARQIDSDYFSVYHFETLLWPSDIAQLNTTLQKSLAGFRLNTDRQPIAYFYNLLLWIQFSGNQPTRQALSLFRNILNALIHLPRWAWLLPCIMIVLIRWSYVRLYPATTVRILRFNSVWAIGTTGCSGMALELILLFTFQHAYGYLYQKTGLIVAVFMTGLALGGYSSYRFARHISSQKELRALLRNEIALAGFAILLPLGLFRLMALFSFPTVEGWILLLAGIAGGLTGYEFPLVSAIYSRVHPDVGRTAGILDSIDHLGALCGSVVVGTLLVPLVGIPFTCYLVGFLKLSSILFLATTSQQRQA